MTDPENDDDPFLRVFTELVHARNDVKTLEAKLAIATENAAQAVKERDEARTMLGKSCRELGVACQDLTDTKGELETLGARLAAAEAVCERVYEILAPYADPKITHLLVQWREMKEKQ